MNIFWRLWWLTVGVVTLVGCSGESEIGVADTPSAPSQDVQIVGKDTWRPQQPVSDLGQRMPSEDISSDIQEPADVFNDEYPPTGTTWYVDIGDGVWERPENIEKLTAAMAEAATFFVGINSRTATTAELILAVSSGEAQDFCSRTIVMDGVALLEDRLFRFGPRDFTIANGTLTQNLMIQGRFSQDFSKIEDMEMEGVLVMDTVPPDILPLPNNTKPCELLSVLTVDCTECEDGSMECLDTRLSQFGGVLVPGLSLVENLKADCHPQCEASTENPECDTSSW